MVEIFSPQQPTQEVMDKIDTYFAFGVKSCWLVSPTMHSVQILTADGRDTVLSGGTAVDYRPDTGFGGGVFMTGYAVRGSKASRRPSPKKFNASKVMTRVAPGNTISHQ